MFHLGLVTPSNVELCLHARQSHPILGQLNVPHTDTVVNTDIADSDMYFNSILKTHCCVSFGTMVTRTRHVTFHIRCLSGCWRTTNKEMLLRSQHAASYYITQWGLSLLIVIIATTTSEHLIQANHVATLLRLITILTVCPSGVTKLFSKNASLGQLIPRLRFPVSTLHTSTGSCYLLSVTHLVNYYFLGNRPMSAEQIKVKSTLEQAMKAQRNRDMALTFL